MDLEAEMVQMENLLLQATTTLCSPPGKKPALDLAITSFFHKELPGAGTLGNSKTKSAKQGKKKRRRKATQRPVVDLIVNKECQTPSPISAPPPHKKRRTGSTKTKRKAHRRTAATAELRRVLDRALQNLSTQPLDIPVPISTPAPKVSFLAFVKRERIKALQYLEKRDAHQKVDAKLQARVREPGLDLPTRKKLWLQLKALRVIHANDEAGCGFKWFNNDRVESIAEFDRCVAPFLDRCLGNNFQDEKELIRLFRVELQGLEPDVQTISHDFCEICGSEFLCAAEDATLYCRMCANVKNYIEASSDNIAYGDEVEYSTFSYKKLNHLMEYLSHLQAKGSYRLPDKTLERIVRYCVKQHWGRDDITFARTKEAMKKLQIGKYEHAMQAYSRIRGCKPLRLDPRCEEKMLLLFLALTPAFERLKPPTRKNFLSYSLCLHEFVKMMGCYDHVLEFLPLLKGSANRKAQQELFHKIRLDLNGKLERIARS